MEMETSHSSFLATTHHITSDIFQLTSMHAFKN